MAEPSDSPRPFDVRTIRYLFRLMASNDVSELDLAEGDQKIRIRRGPRVVLGAAPVAAPVAAHVPAPAPPAAPTADKPAAPAAPAKKLIEIKSPTVGTFYARREPTAPAFVAVGTKVTPTTVVCLIEAMKVYNDVTADCAGTIAEVCVKDKDFVEYNTVLFRVDPAG